MANIWAIKEIKVSKYQAHAPIELLTHLFFLSIFVQRVHNTVHEGHHNLLGLTFSSQNTAVYQSFNILVNFI